MRPACRAIVHRCDDRRGSWSAGSHSAEAEVEAFRASEGSAAVQRGAVPPSTSRGAQERRRRRRRRRRTGFVNIAESHNEHVQVLLFPRDVYEALEVAGKGRGDAPAVGCGSGRAWVGGWCAARMARGWDVDGRGRGADGGRSGWFGGWASCADGRGWTTRALTRLPRPFHPPRAHARTHSEDLCSHVWRGWVRPCLSMTPRSGWMRACTWA